MKLSSDFIVVELRVIRCRRDATFGCVHVTKTAKLGRRRGFECLTRRDKGVYFYLLLADQLRAYEAAVYFFFFFFYNEHF